MIPIHLKLRFIGPFKEVEVDFRKLPDSIIAVVGENGAGKSFFIESVFAALYRTFPSRPSGLYKFCQGTNAQIDYEFSHNGTNYHSILNINAVKLQMEAFLYRNGEPLNDGKNSTFDAAAEKEFGSSKQILASVFACQKKKGSFISLPKSERKALFISMRGLQKLDEISKLAGEKAAKAKAEVDTLNGGISVVADTANKPIPDLEALRDKILFREQETVRLSGVVLEKKTRLAELKGLMSNVGHIKDTARELAKRRVALISDRNKISESIKKSESIIQGIDALKSKAESFKKSDESLLAFRADLGRAQSEMAEHMKSCAALRDEKSKVEREISDLNSKISAAEIKLKHAEADAATIATVPCGAEGDYAKCQFLTRAVKAKSEIDPVTGEIDTQKCNRLHLTQQVKPLPDPMILKEFENRIRDIQGRIKTIETDNLQQESTRRKLAEAEAETGRLTLLGDRLDGIDEDIKTIDSDIATNKENLKNTDEFEKEYSTIEAGMSVEEDALSKSRIECDYTKNRLVEGESMIAKINDAKTKLESLTSQRAVIDRDRISYDLLSKAFGKTGIQSLEIDAAGPEISAIANDLLFSCFGPRFSIKFVTQRPKSGAEGFVDDFDIYVFDSDRNREGSIDDLSGGEEVIVNEAVSLAIALFNRKGSDTGWQTLFRDEVSGALDDNRAPQYISMLRRAREVGHFKSLFFIAHQPKIVDLADVQLKVHDGTVELVG